MHDELLKIQASGIVPVLALPDASDAPAVADAMVAGGLPCVEVTFRTDAAVAAIRSMARRGDMQVGAGTVLTVAQVDAAVDAGATFIVSPGTNPKVVEHCLKTGVPIMPGVATPSEIELALDLGLTTLKYFPAETLGGLAALKAISAPYGMCRFVPTGGIGINNIADYLRFAPVLACGGTWMVAKDLLAAKKFDEVSALCRQAVQLVAQIR